MTTPTPFQRAFIRAEQTSAQLRATALEAYVRAAVNGHTNEYAEQMFARVIAEGETAPALLRAFVIGEGEDTRYVCPTCHVHHFGGGGWPVTTDDEGLEIPDCDYCGTEIDG